MFYLTKTGKLKNQITDGFGTHHSIDLKSALSGKDKAHLKDVLTLKIIFFKWMAAFRSEELHFKNHAKNFLVCATSNPAPLKELLSFLSTVKDLSFSSLHAFVFIKNYALGKRQKTLFDIIRLILEHKIPLDRAFNGDMSLDEISERLSLLKILRKKIGVTNTNAQELFFQLKKIDSTLIQGLIEKEFFKSLPHPEAINLLLSFFQQIPSVTQSDFSYTESSSTLARPSDAEPSSEEAAKAQYSQLFEEIKTSLSLDETLFFKKLNALSSDLNRASTLQEITQGLQSIKDTLQTIEDIKGYLPENFRTLSNIENIDAHLMAIESDTNNFFRRINNVFEPYLVCIQDPENWMSAYMELIAPLEDKEEFLEKIECLDEIKIAYQYLFPQKNWVCSAYELIQVVLNSAYVNRKIAFRAAVSTDKPLALELKINLYALPRKRFDMLCKLWRLVTESLKGHSYTQTELQTMRAFWIEHQAPMPEMAHIYRYLKNSTLLTPLTFSDVERLTTLMKENHREQVLQAKLQNRFPRKTCLPNWRKAALLGNALRAQKQDGPENAQKAHQALQRRPGFSG